MQLLAEESFAILPPGRCSTSVQLPPPNNDQLGVYINFMILSFQAAPGPQGEVEISCACSLYENRIFPDKLRRYEYLGAIVLYWERDKLVLRSKDSMIVVPDRLRKISLSEIINLSDVYYKVQQWLARVITRKQEAEMMQVLLNKVAHVFSDSTFQMDGYNELALGYYIYKCEIILKGSSDPRSKPTISCCCWVWRNATTAFGRKFTPVGHDWVRFDGHNLVGDFGDYAGEFVWERDAIPVRNIRLSQIMNRHKAEEKIREVLTQELGDLL
jgi:hypothetical protein